MEGSDFDFYSSNRPDPEDFPTYEQRQPEVPAEPKIEKEPPKSFWQTYKVFLITGGVCVMILLGVMMLALIGPIFNKVDLEINISEGGMRSGSTLFVDTDNIEFRVKNAGSETAEGEKITLKISGDNIVDKTIQWSSGDIESGKGKIMIISVDIENPSTEFELKISVYYDGDFQGQDQIP